MKIWIKILAGISIILILLFCAAKIFIAAKGKALLVQALEAALQKEVKIGGLNFELPLNVKINDLRIAGLANVDYIYASLSISGLLRGKIIFNQVKVLRPELNWERRLPAEKASTNNPANKSNGGEIDKALAQTKEVLNSPGTETKPSLPISIKYLKVEDGTINFTDRVIQQPGIRLTLREVSLDVDNLYLLPRSVFTNFQLTARIPWQEGQAEGTVYASGWINLYQKDMQARLEIEDIDGVYLHPYYANWVDLENSRIEKAALNIFSDIQGQNNEVIAKCRLELIDIKFRPRPPEQPEHKAEKIATAVLGIFRSLHQGKIILNFTVRTKMDNPEFKFDSITSAVDKTLSQAVGSGKVKMEDVVLLPGRFAERVAKGATGATRAIINGAISVGKSLGDAIMDAFKTAGAPEAEDTSRE